MGQFKARATTMITCELKRWSLDDENNRIKGIITKSIHQKHYPEEQPYTGRYVNIYFYNSSVDFGEAHYIARTQFDTFIRLNISERR